MPGGCGGAVGGGTSDGGGGGVFKRLAEGGGGRAAESWAGARVASEGALLHAPSDSAATAESNVSEGNRRISRFRWRMAHASSVKREARATAKSRARNAPGRRFTAHFAPHSPSLGAMSDGASYALRLRDSRPAIGFGCLLAALSVLGACHRAEAGSSAESGTQTFIAVCAKCHGADGKGGVPAMEGAPPPRNFCDSAFQASRTDEQLKQAIRKGKGGMPAFGNLFPDAELEALVTKIRSFDPAKGH